jgi:hypothetical protein
MKFFLPLMALLFLAGCSTIDKRIQEKSALFNGLDAPTQEQLRKGIVEIGYSPDMVYIALGKPDGIRDRVSADGRELIWTYTSYTQDYAGTGVVGHRRRVLYDPVLKRSYLYWEPVVSDFYHTRVDDRIRITFRDGLVTVIEETKS